MKRPFVFPGWEPFRSIKIQIKVHLGDLSTLKNILLSYVMEKN
jgi:hypothetical protein